MRKTNQAFIGTVSLTDETNHTAVNFDENQKTITLTTTYETPISNASLMFNISYGAILEIDGTLVDDNQYTFDLTTNKTFLIKITSGDGQTINEYTLKIVYIPNTEAIINSVSPKNDTPGFMAVIDENSQTILIGSSSEATENYVDVLFDISTKARIAINDTILSEKEYSFDLSDLEQTYTIVITSENGEEGIYTLSMARLPDHSSSFELSPPADLTALLAYQHKVELVWKDINANETAYVVKRNDKILATLPADSETFIDETGKSYQDSSAGELSHGTHTYSVHAVTETGQSPEGTLTLTLEEIDYSIATSYPTNTRASFEVDRENKDFLFKDTPAYQISLLPEAFLFIRPVYAIDDEVLLWKDIGHGTPTGNHISYDFSISEGVTVKTDLSPHTSQALNESIESSLWSDTGKNILFTPNLDYPFIFQAYGPPHPLVTWKYFMNNYKTAPGVVENMSYTLGDDNTVSLAWESVVETEEVTLKLADPADPNSEDIKETVELNQAVYLIEYKDNFNPEWTKIALIDTSEFTETGSITLNIEAVYRVTPINNGGIGEPVELAIR